MRTLFVALIAVSACFPALAASPYAGEQSREIKALSPQEVTQLREGAGMGLAKAAELNRYPGPMHALELGETLQLSEEQRANLKALMTRHKAEARALGARVLELEGELDALFASGKANAQSVDAVLARLSEASARLRGSHLKTHLETTALLTPQQVDRYVEARGYAAPAPPAAGHKHH